MTTASPLISAEQAAQFATQGFCVIPGLFSESEIQEMEEFFEAYKHTAATFPGEAFAELDKTRHQIRAMHPHRYSKKAEYWALQPNVAAVLEVLFGKPALLTQTMFYFKPPGARGQGMHQDNFYLLVKPATCIAAWTAVDTADDDNGCLWVVPGSQAGDILCPESTGERWLNYGDSHITKFPRETAPVAVPVARGATMFFSGNLIHGSGPNRAKDRSRRTFIGHYVDASSDQVAKFYHPVLDMQGNPVELAVPTGGGPCGDGWMGAVH